MVGDMIGDGAVDLRLLVGILPLLERRQLVFFERPPDVPGHDPKPDPDRPGELGGGDGDSRLHENK